MYDTDTDIGTDLIWYVGYFRMEWTDTFEGERYSYLKKRDLNSWNKRHCQKTNITWKPAIMLRAWVLYRNVNLDRAVYKVISYEDIFTSSAGTYSHLLTCKQTNKKHIASLHFPQSNFGLLLRISFFDSQRGTVTFDNRLALIICDRTLW